MSPIMKPKKVIKAWGVWSVFSKSGPAPIPLSIEQTRARAREKQGWWHKMGKDYVRVVPIEIRILPNRKAR